MRIRARDMSLATAQQAKRAQVTASEVNELSALAAEIGKVAHEHLAPGGQGDDAAPHSRGGE